MNQPANQPFDEDRQKGAVENILDGNTATPDEQGISEEKIALTQDVVGADRAQVADAEQALGADEDGTPG